MKSNAFLKGFSVLLLVLAGCANTASASEGRNDDVPVADGAVSSDGAVADADAGPVPADRPSPTDVPSADVPVPPVRVTVGNDTPVGRGVPFNATGVRALTFHMGGNADETPILGVWAQLNGSLPTTSVGNAYLLAVPRGSVANSKYRYVTGRAVDPVTRQFFIPYDVTLRGGAGMTTSVVVLDFAPAEPNRTFWLTVVGVELPGGRMVSVTGAAGDAFHTTPEAATRIDVTRGPAPAPIRIGQPGQVIATFGMTTSTRPADVAGISLSNRGSAMGWEDIVDLEFWLGGRRLDIAEWGDRLFNNNVRLTRAMMGSTPLEVGASYAFEIRARVNGPAGRTVALYLEYPSDLFVFGDVATCIASTAIGGCSAPGQGSFDGSGDNVNVVTTVP